MARPLRLEHPGAWWHVTNRGVEQRDIFLDDRDRRRFLRMLAAAIVRFRWRLHTYTLMTNHFHLLVETLEPTLSRGMQKLEGDYAEAFNARYRRAGHLFQGRFKAQLIDSESYLLTVARYIVLNPVRARMVSRAIDWPWSSCAATAGLAPVRSWLTVNTLLDRFDPFDRDRARIEYRRYVGDVAAGAKRPWDDLVGQLYLGSKAFIARVQERIEEHRRSKEHPEVQRFPCVATLEQVRECVPRTFGCDATRSGSRESRMAYALLARSEALARLPEIGGALAIGATGASYLIRRGEEMVRRGGRFASRVEEGRLAIRNCRLQM